MSEINFALRRVGNVLTRLNGIYRGERYPYWYVMAYPKSGSTWLTNLLAGYLGVPAPKAALMWPRQECVKQGHWRYHPRLRRVFYIHRDGRDAIVSMYFYTFYRIRNNPNRSFEKHSAARLRRVLGRDYDPDDIVGNLPRFIELELTDPQGFFALSWVDHVRQWYHPQSPNIAYLSYEELRREPVATLSTALSRFLADPVDERRLGEVVRQHDFQRTSGRKPGEEDRSSFLRKGIVGDWVNCFSRQAAEVFDHHAGDMLVKLGYETDRSWPDKYEFASG